MAKKLAIKNCESVFTDRNKKLKDYLKEYLSETSTAFSILLTGPWGSGKTYFIKSLLAELEGKQKVVYVSLNGVSTIEQLEHAILAGFISKKVTTLGRFSLAIGKTFGFTAECLGIEPNTLINEIGDWVETSVINQAKKKAIIFDDIERCQLPIKVWSGYVVTLVDGLNVPTILIGNEIKLLEEKSNGYLQIKEKFVGQTFQLDINIEYIVSSLFLDSKWEEYDAESELKEMCCKVFNQVKSTHKDANYRAFKAALWQLKYWSKKLDECLSKDKLLRLHFLCLFFSLAYCVQLGHLNIKSWDSTETKVGEMQDITPKLSFLDILSDCSKLNPTMFGYGMNINMLLAPQIWKGMIFNENIEESAILLGLQNTSYLTEKKVWEALYYFHNLETSEIEANWLRPHLSK